ncbi:hypothetical protein NEOLEDRAFT_773724 [Neolentinus lepideus HHB14362 ss-1]|uniref:Uncharacterized protein n=1 Tax=Neolentinus lepideus HHB14362 ss-1 TaxID=1314782 RepID=A0A165UUU9_9AGAM|nr:hypothetical protein NEOLEDRAFT_773724 [Neolentinus lepideus HHB14362 ss-1]
MQRLQLLNTALLMGGSAPAASRDGLLDSIQNSSVRQFWSAAFDEKDAYVTRAQFRHALDPLFPLSEQDFDTLWLRLDEFGLDVLTPRNLDAFAGSNSLTEAVWGIHSYREGRQRVSHNGRKCLLWVDDNPENNMEEVAFALGHNIQVYQFTSTAALKMWLEAHQEIRLLDDTSHLRVITDNARWESRRGNDRGKDIFNFSAGENLIRYMRGHQYQAPILVYCGASIPRTGYVLKYTDAGSTTTQFICHAFISGLLAPDADERQWQTFNATLMATPVLNLRNPHYPILQTRWARFGDTDSTTDLFTVGRGGGSLRSFYNGQEVDSRMNHVRDAIHHVRGNWHRYSDFLSGLRDVFLQVGVPEVVSPILSGLPSSKQWADRRRDEDPAEDYGVLRLYTTEAGYSHIFKVVNEAFRTHDIDEQRLISAVFLVELLNIELFNLIDEQRMGDVGFTGIVHRGLCLSTEQLNAFYELTRMPVRERFWSIPLAIVSCSTNENIAVQFALQQAFASRSKHPVLWRIHVTNLSPDLLSVYHNLYPTSVVTTMCAVPIQQFSPYLEEEVVLRGPFFQLVHVYRKPLVDGTMVDVIEGVIFNTNRDHPSQMDLGPAQDDARRLIACMVGMERAK